MNKIEASGLLEEFLDGLKTWSREELEAILNRFTLKYIDIQVLVEGVEKFGHALLKQQQVSKPYDELKDIAFFKGEPEFGVLEPGNFFILFPHDLHMPGVKAEHSAQVKKIVIKVAI